MEFSLSPEHRLLRDTVRDFCEREVSREAIRETDLNHKLPRDLWEKVLSAGLVEWPLPEEAGGAGGDMLGTVIITEELSRAAFPLGIAFLNQAYSAVNSLTHFGTQEQKDRLLGGLLRNETFFGFAFTEPGGGQDILGAMASHAEPQPDGGYILNGAKMFTTMAADSTHLIAIVRTSQGEKRHHGLTMLIIPTDAPGVTVNVLGTIAYWANATCEVFFDDVRLGPEALLGKQDNGWAQIVSSLDYEKVVIAAASVGLAQAALDDAVQYANERHAFGGPIGRFQAIQHPLAVSDVEVQAARLLTYQAAWTANNADRFTVEATRANYYATEVAERVTDRGMRVMAGYGVTTDFDMQRYMRDARVVLFGPITNEMALNVIGQHGLGLPRSY